MAGIYIHIPFCKSRCLYCAFFSSTRLPWRQRYVDALCAEMQQRRHYLAGARVRTLYIGGGTPSVLTPQQLGQLFGAVADTFGPVEAMDEVTVECNPDDVTPALATLLAALGVGRVSMGAQTFDDGRLALLGRRHRADDVARAVACLRRAGIDNVSVDLMYGFPGETAADWQRDIDAALRLDADHLSAYALQYEEGTRLHDMLRRGEITEVDEELSRTMFYTLVEQLAAAGYEHYEISNFARPGSRSQHNSSYWHQVPYLGLGAAAHSYDGASRQWNVSDIDDYIDGVNSGQMDVEQETLDDDTRYNELVMTRLRTCEGLPLNLLSTPRRAYCLAQARRYLDSGLLRLTDDARLCLTPQAVFVSDMVMAQLMVV